MPGKLKTIRDELLKVEAASFYIEHFAAFKARKMVMMLGIRNFVQNNSAGHVYAYQFFFGQQRFDIAVNGGDTQTRAALLSAFE